MSKDSDSQFSSFRELTHFVLRVCFELVWLDCSMMSERDIRTLSCRFCSSSKSDERDLVPWFPRCSSKRETQ